MLLFGTAQPRYGVQISPSRVAANPTPILDRGGVRLRVRGVVLLDALYSGIDKFADWITDNRSTFFVSSYTPHTAPHNAYLERLLRERSVPYSSDCGAATCKAW